MKLQRSYMGTSKRLSETNIAKYMPSYPIPPSQKNSPQTKCFRRPSSEKTFIFAVSDAIRIFRFCYVNNRLMSVLLCQNHRHQILQLGDHGVCSQGPMNLHVNSTYVFDVSSMGETSTSFRRSLFNANQMSKKPTSIRSTFTDVILMGKKSISFLLLL